MLKRSFVVFILVMTTLVIALILFFQSPLFARLVKRTTSRYLPATLGVQLDFAQLSMKLFPPGVSLLQPRVVLSENSVLAVPVSGSIQADRLDISFLPFQALSSFIRIHEAKVVGGNIRLKIKSSDLSKSAKKDDSLLGLLPDFKPDWDLLLKIFVDSVGFENIFFETEYSVDGKSYLASFGANQFLISQEVTRRGPELQVKGDLHSIESNHPKHLPIPSHLDGLKFDLLAARSSGRINHFKFTQKGAVLSISGDYTGNFLKDKKLPAIGKLQLQGPLQDALDTFIGVSMEGTSVRETLMRQASGLVEGTIDFEMDLLHSRETIKMKSDLILKSVRFKNYQADQVNLAAEWGVNSGSAGVTASGKTFPRMGPIKITKLIATAPAQDFKPNASATSVGSGGSIQFSPFVIDPFLKEPIQGQVRLDNAHIHWVAGEAINTLYPLDLRASGVIAFHFTQGNVVTETPSEKREESSSESKKNKKSDKGRLTAEINLQFPSLILSNQKYGHPKPYQKILEVGAFEARGSILVDSSGIVLQKVDLQSPAGTKMVASSDPLTPERLEIRASGYVEGEDVPSLGGIPFKGSGNLDLKVKGSAKDLSLEFRPQLRGVEYLNLKFGDFRGLIIFIEARNRLEFHNIQAQNGSLIYDGSGALELGETESIQIDIHVRKGDVSDFSEIFQNFTEEYWWYPHSTRGPVTGDIKVTGKPNLAHLKVLGRLNGKEWRLKGERFSEVYLEGGLEDGGFRFPSFRIRKKSGEIFGHAHFSDNKVWDWDVRTRGFTLQELDRISSFNVPVQAAVQFQSSGKGKFENLTGQTTLEVSDLRMRSLKYPASRAALNFRQGNVEADVSAFGGQMVSTLRYSFEPKKESSLKIIWDNFDFTPLMVLVNPALADDEKTRGILSGKANVQFRSHEFEKGVGSVSIDTYKIQKRGAEFWIDHPFDIKLSQGSMRWASSSKNGSAPSLVSQKSKLDLALGATNGNWTGRVLGNLDASFFEFVHPLVDTGKGKVELNLDVNGPLKAPSWLGTASAEGCALRIKVLESLLLENIVGRAQIKDQLIFFQKMESDLSGGRALASGSVGLFLGKDPDLKVSLQLISPKLKIYPFQVLKLNGNLDITGEQRPYLVQGSVRTDSGISREKFFQNTNVASRDSVLYQPKPRADQWTDLPTFVLNISADSPGGVLFQNDLLDANLKGQMRIVGTSDIPRPLGSAEVIEGRIFFKDHAFQIQSASILFESAAVFDPAFNLTAQTDVSGTKISMNAQGKKSKNRVEFTSNPPMAESDILSLLAFGTSQDDIRRLGGADRGVYQPGEAASLLLHSMDFNREFQSKTGFQIQLDEAVNTQQGTSAFQRSTDVENGASPKIVFRRPIGKKLSLSVGSTVGVGTGNQQEVNAEMKVTPGFSVIGVYDTTESTVDAKRRDSYGLDLKLQKRFK